MRVRLKGIHRVGKRLANGRVQTYYYAWRGGPRLVGEPGSPEFISSYFRAHNERRRNVEETLKGVIADFQVSSEYQRLSSSSRREYLRYFALIEAAFGDMPLNAVEDPRARGLFKMA
jgi:hypothetical protein